MSLSLQPQGFFKHLYNEYKYEYWDVCCKEQYFFCVCCPNRLHHRILLLLIPNNKNKYVFFNMHSS